MVTQTQLLNEIRDHPGITTRDLALHFLEKNPRYTYQDMRLHIINRCSPLMKSGLIRNEPTKYKGYRTCMWFPEEAAE